MGGNGGWSLGWDKDGEAGQALENQGGRTRDEASLHVPDTAFSTRLDFIHNNTANAIKKA